MTQSSPNRNTYRSSASNSTIAGASAGFVSSVVTCPLDVIKTKLQAQKALKGSPEYLGVSATVRQILLRDGLKGLYRGLGPTMMGYLPTWAIYFTVYDGVKGRLGQPPTGYDANIGDLKPSLNPWPVHLLASVTAGATGTICTSPLWVVKTRFMTQRPEEVRFKHTWDAFRIIYRNDGLKAFYRGLIPSLFGVTHVLVQFPLYEQLKDWYSHRLNVPKSHLPTWSILVCTTISKSVATLITYPHEVVRTRLQIRRQKPSVPPSSNSHPPHDYQAAPYRQMHSQVPPRPPDQGAMASAAPASNSGVTSQRPISTLGMCMKIWREGSWRGFYKGMGINLVRTIPNSAMTLLTYELVMRLLADNPP
ncbi:hypothetical protein FRC04_002142 [Tulasnella sp. 424]|nr:hypothetical protein FRC04_002142 [Tulasnella sp. 424]